MHYGNPTDSIAYRNFKDLYSDCTRTLNTPRKISDDGLLMLPDMWRIIRQRRMKTKRLFLIAMLYLLYRQHDVPIVFTQFLKYAHVPQEKLHRISQLVMKQFNLPMFKSMNRKDITANSISELVKLVFKESRSDMERETEKLANRVSHIIYKEGWGETSSKNYISLVSIVSTILSAQYVCSNETSRKTKGGRKCCFRFKTLNYQKMADHMCVHVMAVKKGLKCIQSKLFKVVEFLPWVAAAVKRTIDVGRVLVDVIDHIDIDVKDNNTIEEIPSAIPRAIKLVLLGAILEYVTVRHDVMVTDRPQINMADFRSVLEKWRENDKNCYDSPSSGVDNTNKTESNDLKSTLNTTQTEEINDNKNTDGKQSPIHTNNNQNIKTSSQSGSIKLSDKSEKKPVFAKDHILFDDYVIKFEYLELYKDLLLSGCTIQQLLDDDYISLVEKYVDMPNVADEHEMEEFTEHEMALYFKDPGEFVPLEEKQARAELLDGTNLVNDHLDEPKAKRGKLSSSLEKAIPQKVSVGQKSSLSRLSATICDKSKTSLLEEVESCTSSNEDDNAIEVKEELNSSFSSVENES